MSSKIFNCNCIEEGGFFDQFLIWWEETAAVLLPNYTHMLCGKDVNEKIYAIISISDAVGQFTHVKLKLQHQQLSAAIERNSDNAQFSWLLGWSSNCNCS